MISNGFHLCEHPGCTRWALHGRTACAVHIGRTVASSARSIPACPPPADTASLSSLNPIDLVTAHRDSLHRYLHIRAGYHVPGIAREFRYLRALARTNADLGIAPDDTSAMDEIDAFLDTIAERVLEREAQEP